MPVHPLAGKRVRVRRWLRTFHGERYVEIEFPAGRGLRLPARWVDGPIQSDGQAAPPRLGVAALVQLVSLIGAKLDEAIDSAIIGRDDDGNRYKRRQQGRKRAGQDSRRAGLVATDAGAEINATRNSRVDGSAVDARKRGRRARRS